MARHKQKDREAEIIETAMLRGQEIPGREKPEQFEFETFKFEKIEDFDVYNAQVRKHNRLCLHERNKMKVKIPDESYYKKYKTKFHRFQQPENVLKVRVRNRKIDWKGELKNGGTYMLPLPVIEFLNGLAIPEFAEVKTEHGSAVHTETKQVGETPRFSCNVLDYAA
jgi:hypothetical protein